MTPAARVQAAIEILDDILNGAPAEKVLTVWARGARFAGSKDRAAIRDHVYDVLRAKDSCAASGGGETGRALMIGLLRRQSVVLSDIFSGTGYGPEPLDFEEEKGGNSTPRLDVPDWLVSELESALGEDFSAIVEKLKQRAEVILRVNFQKATAVEAARVLAEDGIATQAHPAALTALSVTEGARRVAQSKAFQSGLIELQDASSQAAIAALPLTDSMRVLDYCAGGGGKVLAMAGQSQAEFFAHDAYAQRMKDIPVRAKRAGARVKLLTTPEVAPKGPYDLVFCDVPCSGSGTWRRDPDAKWRLTPDALQELCDVQHQILMKAQQHVAAGGYLAYATCSLLDRENASQINRFLDHCTEWSLVNQKRWTPLDGCDGFFTALLSRKS